MPRSRSRIGDPICASSPRAGAQSPARPSSGFSGKPFDSLRTSRASCPRSKEASRSAKTKQLGRSRSAMRRRTFWHLEGLKRKPTDYDIATSRLLYHPDRGFEVNVPFSSWVERYGKNSALRISDWERFRDPRETTYSKYTE